MSHNLHRAYQRYPRHHGEAFRTPEWSTALHGPYTPSKGVLRYVVGALCLLAWAFVWRIA
jgi:hypothetical protein